MLLQVIIGQRVKQKSLIMGRLCKALLIWF